MHILFLSDNFPPEVNAPASRTFEHCRQWVEAGHQVTVVTCAPNFPAGKLMNGYRNRLWQEEEIAGIRVIRVWSYITANDGFAKRTLDYLSYMVAGTIGALFVRKPDVIVGTSPQFFTAVAAWTVAFCKRRPWVFELRDIWPESIKTVGAAKDGIAIRLLERLEMFLYRASDRIVAVTYSFRDTLARRGIDPAKIDVVTNGVDLDNFAPRPKDAALLTELNLEGRFVAGYIGTHGMAHALETLLDAAGRLARDPKGRDIVILLLGDGARKAALKAEAEARGLDNLIFLDPVAKDQVGRYWSLLDASIIHLRASELFETVIPSKMFEALAMGIPILLGVRGEAAGILNRSGGGETFTPENGEELAARLVAMREDPGLCRKYSAAGIASAPQYERRTLAGRLLDILVVVSASGRGRGRGRAKASSAPSAPDPRLDP
ncbi:glycosyltransferase family 4 protein [Nostoc ellipsosporum NOK]|nr:glycosyltransferase family 4 protein [Nostoc ellipsosporum NOK]